MSPQWEDLILCHGNILLDVHQVLIIFEKYMHINVFTKNQGRAADLPSPTGSFTPGCMCDMCAAANSYLAHFKLLCENLTVLCYGRASV
jgi:hypothetical protein